MSMSDKGDAAMEKRWHGVWPTWAPRSFEPEKPVCEYIRNWAALTPRRPAVSFYGATLTYAELNEAIDRFANALARLGVKKGDRVAIHMDNCPQFVIAYFAAHRAGAVAVPVNPMFKRAEIVHELTDAGTRVLIGQASLYAEVESERERIGLTHVILTDLSDYAPQNPTRGFPGDGRKAATFPGTLFFKDVLAAADASPLCLIDDLKSLCLLQYTGGTTGTPKGAMISHHALTAAGVGSMFWFHTIERDVYLGVAPFFHVMGEVPLMCNCLVGGAELAILARFDPTLVAETISAKGCTQWVAATTMLIALLNLPNLAEYDFSSLRVILTGGAPVSVEIQERVRAIAPDAAVAEGYGLSENTAQGGAITPIFRHKPGFIGIPQINNDMKIVDLETGTRELPPNTEGEIVLKSAALMDGYWNAPEETARVLRNGWLHTGDIGLMDEEGYVKFLGRNRELIKCSGFSVFPAEVEGLLYMHPAVAEAAVIGVPDEYRGETPKAFIVVKESHRGKVCEAEILDWCRANMAAYKKPTLVEFRVSLPKSGAGKLLKRILVDEEAAKREGGSK